MPDPTGRVSHLPEMHRGVAWKEPCRAATTANIVIATALNNGDTLDGVTLVTGDRVLVKDQSTGSQNGIYVVGASPFRDYDMDQDATTDVPATEVRGAFVWVFAGTANGGKLFKCVNTNLPVIGTDTITFEEFSGGTSLSDDTPLVESGSGDPGVGTEASRSDHVHPATTSGEILISDTPSTPLVFADLLQNEAQDDLVYADT